MVVVDKDGRGMIGTDGIARDPSIHAWVHLHQKWQAIGIVFVWSRREFERGGNRGYCWD